MVLRVGRSSLLFPEEIEVKTSQWLRQKAPCWNYFLLMPKPFHRLKFLCSFRVMLSRKGRKSQVWNQINQQKISTRKYFKYFFPFFLLVCITEISFQVIISNVYFTDMRNFILSCLLNIQNVPTWNLTHSIRYSACADAVLKCLNWLLLQRVIKTECRGCQWEQRPWKGWFILWMRVWWEEGSSDRILGCSWAVLAPELRSWRRKFSVRESQMFWAGIWAVSGVKSCGRITFTLFLVLLWKPQASYLVFPWALTFLINIWSH